MPLNVVKDFSLDPFHRQVDSLSFQTESLSNLTDGWVGFVSQKPVGSLRANSMEHLPEEFPCILLANLTGKIYFYFTGNFYKKISKM